MTKRVSRPWTEEDLIFAYKNIHVVSDEELEEELGRDISNIRASLRSRYAKGTLPRVRKLYCQFEDDFILDNYGVIDLDEICRRLFRSKNSIIRRVTLLLGTSKASAVSGRYDTYDVSEILGIEQCYVSRIAKENRSTFDLVSNGYFVDQDRFFEWLKDNLNYVQAHKIDYDKLYHCPEWYKEYVNAEKFKLLSLPKRTKMTPSEITLIKHLRSKGYSYSKIAKEVNRTYRSIKWIFEKEQRKLKQSS